MSAPWFRRLIDGLSRKKATGGREILVVDDEPEICAMAQEMLAGAGWQVCTAGNREEALARLGSGGGRVGLALVDVMMPDSDGISLATALRQAQPGVEIVMLSGRLNEESRWVVNEHGHRFLPKPFGCDELRDVVESILGEPPARPTP